MKNPPTPPVKGTKPMTPKRQKILALAMAQLQKTRAQMDPTILKKIRDIISKNPKIMKSLGVDEMPEEKKIAQEEPKLTPISKKVVAPTEAKSAAPNSEKIDQGKNMETIAKLMQLKPSEIKNIKSVLLKSKD